MGRRNHSQRIELLASCVSEIAQTVNLLCTKTADIPEAVADNLQSVIALVNACSVDDQFDILLKKVENAATVAATGPDR